MNQLTSNSYCNNLTSFNSNFHRNINESSIQFTRKRRVETKPRRRYLTKKRRFAEIIRMVSIGQDNQVNSATSSTDSPLEVTNTITSMIAGMSEAEMPNGTNLPLLADISVQRLEDERLSSSTPIQNPNGSTRSNIYSNEAPNRLPTQLNQGGTSGNMMNGPTNPGFIHVNSQNNYAINGNSSALPSQAAVRIQQTRYQPSSPAFQPLNRLNSLIFDRYHERQAIRNLWINHSHICDAIIQNMDSIPPSLLDRYNTCVHAISAIVSLSYVGYNFPTTQ